MSRPSGRPTERGNSYLRELEFPGKIVPPGGIPVQPGGSDGGAGALSQATNLGPTGSTLNVSPWWLYEYESAQDWYSANIQFVLAAGAQNFAVPNFGFTVPQGNRMVLKQFIIGVQNPTTAINVSVALMRGNAPISGFSQVFFLPMAAATQDLPFNDLNLRFNGTDQFSAQFSNGNAGTAWTLNIQASGWYVLQTEIDRLQGGVRY